MAAIEFDSVSKTYGGDVHAVDALDLLVEDGEFVVLLGPSGCGKSTALRMVAGLESITDGEIRIGGRPVNNVEPRDRDVAMVFQNYALYPHMNVRENIGFGLRMRGVPKRERASKVDRGARSLGLTELLERKPSQLSGGQRQRVAMGRAIVREPQAFLMDEPLSNLDARLRTQMRTEIVRLQHELDATTVYVTHDQVEAMTMADRVAVMRGGVLQQFDTPDRVYAGPANLFVASFIGSPAMNLVVGTIEDAGSGLSCRIGSQSLRLAPEAARRLGTRPRGARAHVAVGIRPESLSPAVAGAEALVGEVVVSESLGFETLVYARIGASAVVHPDVLDSVADVEGTASPDGRDDGEGTIVVARVRANTVVRPGEPIRLAVETADLQFFDLDDGSAIA
jgi:multiple sugar transport system ATP-binding protein